jgi:hypothetical protein
MAKTATNANVNIGDVAATAGGGSLITAVITVIVLYIKSNKSTEEKAEMIATEIKTVKEQVEKNKTDVEAKIKEKFNMCSGKFETIGSNKTAIKAILDDISDIKHELQELCKEHRNRRDVCSQKFQTKEMCEAMYKFQKKE